MSTLAEIGNLKGSSNAITRWATFGPYYAMFPIEFAFDVVDKYSQPGDYIIDPFAGRCSSVYAGGALGRNSLGIEINPLGWLYGTVKLNPAPQQNILTRLQEIYDNRYTYQQQVIALPEFFQMCFCNEVLCFLLSARENLDWQNNPIDRTLISIILVHLHGKLGEGLSNQMRQTKAMGPTYSINWWKSHNMTIPPSIDPFTFIRKKIEWRYAKGTPSIHTNCQVIWGDSTNQLESIIQMREQGISYSLLFTSPPYHAIVDYHADQWLRLWLLRGEDRPRTNPEKYKGRFNSREDYQGLLTQVFSNYANLMADRSTIFVRTDARSFTFDTTLKVLEQYFPNHQRTIVTQPLKKPTQTDLFNKNQEKHGEVDIILQN